MTGAGHSDLRHISVASSRSMIDRLSSAGAFGSSALAMTPGGDASGAAAVSVEGRDGRVPLGNPDLITNHGVWRRDALLLLSFAEN